MCLCSADRVRSGGKELMFSYRRARKEDVPFLIASRLKLLQSANDLGDPQALQPVKEQLQSYYKKIETGEHIEYLAYKGLQCVGSGGICFYQVLPTYHNPTGRRAYIANMYTLPEFRKRGIASKILDYLVKEAFQREIEYISLEATSSGRTVYEKYGFISLTSEMQLMNKAYDKKQNSGID